MKTIVISSEEELVKAAEIINNGGISAVPTETVYGLAANGLSENAVAGIYRAKGRPENKPISLFVSGIDDARNFCSDIPESAYELAGKFWPGPLTMVFKRKNNVPDIITAGGDTVGVRCPANELTLALLKMCGVPLTGTSANLSGQPNANDIEEVMGYFDGAIECAVDGGKCTGGIPSTVLDMTGEIPKILRAGGVTKEEIENVLKTEVL